MANMEGEMMGGLKEPQTVEEWKAAYEATFKRATATDRENEWLKKRLQKAGVVLGTEGLRAEQLVELGYPPEIAENVRRLIERAEKAETQVLELREALQPFADPHNWAHNYDGGGLVYNGPGSNAIAGHKKVPAAARAPYPRREESND